MSDAITNDDIYRRVEAAIVSLLGEVPGWAARDDGDYVISVSDEDPDEGDETLTELRAMLPPGWCAEWTGESNGDADGYTTSDIRIFRAAGK